jgi:hypothetical protein
MQKRELFEEEWSNRGENSLQRGIHPTYEKGGKAKNKGALNRA